MGYHTEYKGGFLFSHELTASQLSSLKKFLGEDTREHKDWTQVDNGYISVQLNEEFNGIEWDGCEKTRGMDEIVNFVIDRIKEINPQISLSGEMECQGEDFEDRYKVVIKNGRAVVAAAPIKGKKILCPNCDEHFYYES